MPKICYVPRKFSAETSQMIAQADAIIAEYQAQGFDLTLRQLYYQFVSRALLANKDSEYKRLGSIVNDARLAGLIDWHAIVDRTRVLRAQSHWTSPAGIMESAYYGYREELWKGQAIRPEVWVEKDALVGVISGVCNELDVPYFACRGYVSQSEMWHAAQRLRGYTASWGKKQVPMVIHLGDHDPSGKDMTRDIVDRLQLFVGKVKVDRIALNMDQVEHYGPPPNPAKITDSRADVYIAEYGDESWELDALEPAVIADLIRTTVLSVRDEDAWRDAEQAQALNKLRLQQASARWSEIVAFLDDHHQAFPATDDDEEEATEEEE